MTHKNLLEICLLLTLWIFKNQAMKVSEEDAIDKELNPEICESTNTNINLKNINNFKNCNTIEGDVILSKFDGNLNDLEVFSTVRQISGTLRIEFTDERLKNLSFFRNLEVIGRGLVVSRTQIVSLSLTSLKIIKEGLIIIYRNPQLCYIESLTWSDLIYIRFFIFIDIQEGCKVKCDKECLCGCWGPGPTQCQPCENLKLKNDCMERCYNKFFENGTKNRSTCRELCLTDEIGIELKQKICITTRKYVTLKTINNFKNCNIIEGDVILSGFDGNLNDLEVFSTVKQISGTLRIDFTDERLRNLSFFKNLEYIGQELVVFNTQLVSLGLTSLRRIDAGNILIHENPQLCYINSLIWQNYIYLSFHQSINIDSTVDCKVKCDKKCLCGCWGPGPTQCQSCENLIFKNHCIEICDERRFSKHEPRNLSLCQELCVTCTGPTFEDCKCKYVQDGKTCKRECPAWKYNDHGICKECHEHCLDGCTGPWNKIGKGGCNNCRKLSIYSNATTYCLGENQTCPERLVGKTIYLRHQDIIKKVCVPRGDYRFKRNKIFGISCVSSHYRYIPTNQEENDRNIIICKPCFSECQSCYGPGQNQCHRCRNFRVYKHTGNLIDSETLPFNCSNTCPVRNSKKKYRYPPHNRIEIHCYSLEVNRKILLIKILLFSTFIGISMFLIIIKIYRRINPICKYQRNDEAKEEKIPKTFPHLPDYTNPLDHR